MCWPSGVMPQRCALASLASRNTSLRVCRSNTPRRFTHGPRLVETVTSGLVVTMCAASSFSSPCRGRSRPGCRRSRPAWTSSAPPASATGSAAGTGTTGAVSARPSGVSLRRERHALDERAAIPPAGASSPSNRSHSWPGADVHAGAEHLHLLLASSARHGCPCGRRTAAPCP